MKQQTIDKKNQNIANMQRAWLDSKPENNWKGIRKARTQVSPFRTWATGFIEGILVIIVTLAIFGWMPWWPEIRGWLWP